MMNKIKIPLLIILPGVLLWAAWPPVSLWFFMFLGFIPMFQLEREMAEAKKWKWFLAIYASLLLWNISTTWWVWNSTAAGALVMLIFNTLFMCIPWGLYRYSRRKIGEPAEYLFVVFWLTYEFLHHRWELSWPWLTLGNGLADAPWLVQWYDITGTLGGSAFILAMNVLLWKALRLRKPFYPVAAAGLFLFVWLSSVFNGWKWEKTRKPTGKAEVVVCQPSFDPWEEKFVRDPMDLEKEMIAFSEKAITPNTKLLVWPETSLTDRIDTDYPNGHPLIQRLRELQQKHPGMRILTGADMQQVYRNCPGKPNSTARGTSDPRTWWNAYNSGILLEDKDSISYYHKSILVPGTEKMPFTDLMPFIDKWAISLDENSISGSLGKSERPKALGTQGFKVAPIICYESIYGEYTGRYVNDGAELLCVVTNDAWWGNTPGYKQHLAYSRLRAIEHRRWVARSANTGISGFIDSEGKIVRKTKWWEKTAVSQEVELYNYKTLYARMGDLVWLLILSAICLALGTALYLKTNRS